jgi:hypothetical protein
VARFPSTQFDASKSTADGRPAGQRLPSRVASRTLPLLVALVGALIGAGRVVAQFKPQGVRH